jgi:hypothetical protein
MHIARGCALRSLPRWLPTAVCRLPPSVPEMEAIDGSLHVRGIHKSCALSIMVRRRSRATSKSCTRLIRAAGRTGHPTTVTFPSGRDWANQWFVIARDRGRLYGNLRSPLVPVARLDRSRAALMLFPCICLALPRRSPHASVMRLATISVYVRKEVPHAGAKTLRCAGLRRSSRQDRAAC